MTGETKFSVLVSLFTWIQKSRMAARKRSKFRKFLDAYCKPADYFSAVRLILPSLDRERGTYGLKESVLATSLIDALGISRDSEDALRLINWRKGGAKTGSSAGNFALVASEVLQRRQGMASGELTIKELNDLLDRLASSESRAEKISVLSTLIKKTNAQEMKWIIMIILKDLKLGTSEKSIFHEFHPDAEDLFNVTCDLKLVCEKLRDRSQRHKRQDIEVGKAVRPQLAMRVSGPASAWKKLHGKEVVAECKFDGDRIQIHKNGTEVHFFSRNFLDHSEYGPGMSDVIMHNVLANRCILDGEMMVWDTSLNRFAEFGSNQEIAKAAREGLESDRQLCYVAFDVLYVGDTSVIHRSLRERHELLQQVVKSSKSRLEILVPNDGLNSDRSPGEPCWSRIVYSVDDAEKFFRETIENRDEGIVLKDLGSKWEPSDRSGKWLKLKPEYVRTGSDLDVLIIGGYYGSGRRGGEVAQFLVGLAERAEPNAFPRRFVSFCRVGTGLSDDELEAVIKKLKPYLRKYEYPKKPPPSFYQVTNNAKERPDVWVESPEKSIILSITSDIRTISSEVFAAPYSLRFPRIDQVRYDKPWHECLDVQSFIELVHSTNGSTQKEIEYGGPQDNRPKRKGRTRKGEKQNMSVVPSHFVQTDTSGIKGETAIFSNMVFYFVNVPPIHSLNSFHKMVVENGGVFSMNLNNSVTHCVAAESKGLKYQAAKLHGDVIHCSWVMDCCSLKQLVPLQPKYFLFLSDSSKKKLEEDVDEFSDPYYWDLDLADIKQLVNNVNKLEDIKAVDKYKKKLCPKDRWCLFSGCSIFFHLSTQCLKSDWEDLMSLVLRRLKLEVLMCGGKLSDNLDDATHLVVFSSPGSHLDINYLKKSLLAAGKQVRLRIGLHIVGSQWLEESLAREEKLQEDLYNLKLTGIEELYSYECGCNQALEEAAYNQNQKVVASPGPERKSRLKAQPDNSKPLVSQEDGSRKQGRSARRSTNKIKAGLNQKRGVRGRIGARSAKIHEYESDGGTSDEKPNEEEGKSNEESGGIKGCISGQNLEDSDIIKAANAELLHEGNVSEQEHGEDMGTERWSTKAPDIEVCGSSSIINHGSAMLFRPAEIGESNNDQGGRKDDNIGVLVDPVQSMLLDMIPSLSQKQEIHAIPVVNDEKADGQSLAIRVGENESSKYPVAEPEKVCPETSLPPVKKRKVSYKDVAGELLKDW